MFLRSQNIIKLTSQCRWKSEKKHIALQQKKKSTTHRALENFDDFYKSVYNERWKNIRVALLTEHKYVALINNFGDTEKTCELLETSGAINIRSLVNLAKQKLSSNRKIVASDSGSKLDDKLQEIIKKQEEREKTSLYCSVANENENNSPLSDNTTYIQTEGYENVTYKLGTINIGGKNSLEEAIKEDFFIDTNRLVNPSISTGGLYEYIPANKIKGMDDWVPESDYYKYYQTTEDFPLKIEPEQKLYLPINLNIYTYEMGNCSEFKSPMKCATGVSSHFLMDGASILPPLLLDIKHGERVLDACSAPGGKSLLMLQTLHPELLVCNDIQESRINRVRRLMQEYLFDYKERWESKRLLLTESDARNLNQYESYDKILVDVPCTTDRHSLTENDNNIFKPTRIKERLRLPELQADILTNCLRLLRPGGTLVYSTCSLSPVQNDGVVHMALQKAFSEYGITTTIKDLSMIVQYFRDIFRFEPSKNLKYGQMVIPYLPANFGPMYFSKITRN